VLYSATRSPEQAIDPNFWEFLLKPYLSYRTYLNEKYGKRIQKISIDAGFSCPNRDGTKGKGGCTYCIPRSFTPAYIESVQPIPHQLEKGKLLLEKRYKPDAYIAYFQSFSNTYGELDHLKALYEEALADPQVIGLSIGTRPDCVDSEKLDYLAELALEYDITIEYGLESSHQATLDRINRLDTIEMFDWAVDQTHQRNINMGAHVILGLPGESVEMMYETARFVAQRPIKFLKLHHLHIVKGTLLGRDYEREPFELFDLDSYLEVAGTFIRMLRPDMVLQRVVGETHPRHLLGPHWGLRSYEVIEKLESYMRERNWKQGDLFAA